MVIEKAVVARLQVAVCLSMILLYCYGAVTMQFTRRSSCPSCSRRLKPLAPAHIVPRLRKRRSQSGSLCDDHLDNHTVP